MNVCKTFEEHVEVANKLAEENGGILQYPEWLCKNGYNKIVSCMRKYPELFKHIKQESKRKTPEEWVKVAEKLAEENGGLLPNSKWLQQNGYSGFVQCMRKYPEAFKNIVQERKLKTLEENVELAEQLAAGDGGTLPNVARLQQNGHNGLVRCMRKYPEAFKHIKQESKRNN